MNKTPFNQMTVLQQLKTWQRIRKIRQAAANAGNYATADFMELLEKLITGKQTHKITLQLSQAQVSFEVKKITVTIPQ